MSEGKIKSEVETETKKVTVASDDGSDPVEEVVDISVVEKWLKDQKHPRRKQINRVREIILSADPKIEECIKWNSPTFLYKGNMASFFMNATSMVSLMFHKGALLPNEGGLLTGDSKLGRVARFDDMEDIESKREALVSLVHEWVAFKDQE